MATAALVRDLAEHGFAVLESPRVSLTQLRRGYELAEMFFARPTSWKHQWRIACPIDQPRGHTYFGPSLPLSVFSAMRKEAWHFGLPPMGSAAIGTPWPAELLEFRSHLEQLLEGLLAVAVDTLTECESFLQLGTGSLTRIVSRHGSFVRVLRYPEVPEQCNDPYLERTTAHKDESLLTVMGCPTGSGLEVEDPRFGWVELSARDSQLIINVGQILHLVSQGRLPSVRHRVRTRGHAQRMSMPLFVMPERAAIIPRAHSSGPDHAEYTAGDYLDAVLPRLPTY